MLAVTRWVCRAGSPAREERWRKAIEMKPEPGSMKTPPLPRCTKQAVCSR